MKSLIALYETEDIARKVSADLISAGIDQDNIRVEGGVYEDAERHEGGISGFFNWLFGNDSSRNDADVYAESLRRGDWAVIVYADENDNVNHIEDIMYSYNPIDVDGRGAYFRQSGWTQYDHSSSRMSDADIERDRQMYRTTDYDYDDSMRDDLRHNTSDEQRLEVVEEDLEVGKREVERGRVRIRTYVTERPVEAKVNLREEHVRVERHAVNRPAGDADFNTFDEGTIEITEMAEEPVVSKSARVVEEVVVGKETTEHTETIRDNVRRKDVEVDPHADTKPHRTDLDRDLNR